MAQVELYVRQPGHPERRYLVSSGVTVIGRADDNEVVLSDLGVSRRHARVSFENGTLSVEDLGSGNGTWYRGEEIQKQALVDGDEIQIDPFVLVFRFQQGEPVRPAVADEDDRTLKSQMSSAIRNSTARLVVLAGHRLASVYPIPATGLSMGRSESRDVVLFDPGASRNHLRIEFRNGGFWLVDLGSANGTYLNGDRARENPLMPGDHIRIGSTEFRMEIPDASPDLMHRSPGPTRPDPVEMGMEPHPASLGTPPPRSAGPLNPRLARRKGPSRMEWALAAGVVAGLALVIVTGVVLAKILSEEERESRGEEVSREAIDLVLDADLSEYAKDRMAEGQIRFHEGDYFLAVQNFIEVNEGGAMDDAPRYIPAIGLENTTYEAIVLDVLLQELDTREQGESGQKRARARALKSAREALDDGFGQADARKAVLQAQGLGGRSDKELMELKDRLDHELVKTTEERSNRSFRSGLADRVREGNQQLDNGNYRAAAALYEGVIEADQEASTHSFYDAKDGLRTAKERMSVSKKQQWKSVEKAYKSNDDEAAAAALKEILRIDPDDESAASQLDDLKARL